MHLSVIIPVYNAKDYISIALDSALNQKQTKEIIVIDDGSKDGTIGIVKNYCRANAIVKLYFHPNNEHRGIAQSRNFGISKVSQPYFSWLDADDYYLPNRFKFAERILDRELKVDGVYAKMQNFVLDSSNNLRLENVIELKEDIDSKNLFLFIFSERHHYFSHCSLVLRTENAKSFKYDDSLEIGEDIDYIYHITRSLNLKSDGQKIPSIFRRIHTSNISIKNKNIDHNKIRFQIVQKWVDKIKNEKFSPQEIKTIILRYLSQRYLVSKNSEQSYFRYFIKAYYLGVLFLKKNWLFTKLLKSF